MLSGNRSEIFPKKSDIVEINEFVFDVTKGVLRTPTGEIVELRAQSAKVLAVLANAPGEIIAKDNIINEVWPETFVTDDSLTQCIKDIRYALNDHNRKLIQTRPKQGYSLNASPAPSVRRGVRPALYVLFALFAALLIVLGFARESSVAPDHPRLAVLRFVDESVGVDRNYLSNSISQGVQTELTRFPEFNVISGNSSFRFDADTPDIGQIVDDLGVHYLVLGTQAKSGNKLRINVQLLDGRTRDTLWADSYDRPLKDFFDVQSEIVRTISSTIGFKVAHNPPPGDGLARLSALRYHLQGRTHIRASTQEDTEKARHLNLQAIEADPSSPYGYIGMAFVYRHLNNHGWSSESAEETLRKAAYFADKALEISPDNYAAHHARGRIHIQTGELDQAILRLKNAIALNPSAAAVMMALSNALVYRGEVDEAIRVAKEAKHIDPFHPEWFHWDMAWALWSKGLCNEAQTEMREMVNIPNQARLTKAAIEVCIGDLPASRKTITKFNANAPNYTVSKDRNIRGRLYHNTSDLERWSDALAQAGLPD